jgi:hypothetical protein
LTPVRYRPIWIRIPDWTIQVEIKKTANPGRNSIGHFSTSKKLDKPVGTGALICMLESHLPLANDINAVPFGYVV